MPNLGESNFDRENDQYNELYVFYFKKLYKYGSRFTTDLTLIQDSIQDVFADLWQNRHKRAGINSPECYIFSAFRYTLFRKIKQSLKVVQQNVTDLEPTFSHEDLIVVKEANEAQVKKLSEALMTLTARQKEAIYLRFYAGLSYEEVAKILDISVKATYKIMARSLSALKESMVLTVSAIFLFLFLFC